MKANRSFETSVAVYSFHVVASENIAQVGIASRYGLDGPGIESRWGGHAAFINGRGSTRVQNDNLTVATHFLILECVNPQDML